VAGARQIVDPPTFTTLPYGLWDAAQKPTIDNPHWQQGVTWIERCPTGDTTYDECLSVTGTGAPPEPAAKTDNVDQTFRGATPFTIFTEFDCSPVGGLRDAATVAEDALARIEAKQLETAFWTGTAGGQTLVFPHLAADAEVLDTQDIVLQPAATPLVTGGADVAHALGALEAELADCYAGQGLIHIPRDALPTFAAWNLLVERDGSLYTPAGNLIVVGGGYTGSGPDGTPAPAGTSWIYATGPVFGYRGDVQVTSPRDSIDRAANTLRMIAERTYVLAYECCLLAAHIVLGVPTE
jgi:hypothetical protein